MASQPAKNAAPLGAAILSSLVPGTGQMVRGRLRRGLVFLAPFAALVVWIFVASGSGSELAARLVQPGVLWFIFGVNLVVLGYRLFASWDAWNPAPPGALAIGGLLVVWGLTAIPHLVAGFYTVETISTLRVVFPTAAPATDDAAVSEAATTSVTASVAPLATSSTTTPGPLVSFVPVPPGSTTIPDPGDDQLPQRTPLEVTGVGRLTVLLAGGDAGPGRTGLRTDSMMVATVNVETGHGALFGIPRNFARVPLPEKLLGLFPEPLESEDPLPPESTTTTTLPPDAEPEEPCDCFPQLLNALYGQKGRYAFRYPDEADPGMAALRDTLEELLGIQIDHYALVDMEGFEEVVNAVGGIDLFVPDGFEITISPAADEGDWRTFTFDAGYQHMNGAQALAYARTRTETSDYVRMHRQRCLMSALADSADPLSLVRGYRTILGAVKDHVTTDLPLWLLPDFVRIAANTQSGAITTVGFTPPTYVSGSDKVVRGWIPDPEKTQRKVSSVLRADPAEIPNAAPLLCTEPGR